MGNPKFLFVKLDKPAQSSEGPHMETRLGRKKGAGKSAG